MEFCHNWPLISSSQLSSEEIIGRLLAPSTILLSADEGNCIVMFEGIIPGRDANTGFLFWNRKVSENQQLLADIFHAMVRMMALQRLTSYVPEKNRIMYRMYEKLGFKQEGRLRNAFFMPDGRVCDYFLYGKLKEEFV